MLNFWTKFLRAIVSFILFIPLAGIGFLFYEYIYGVMEIEALIVGILICIGVGLLFTTMSIALRITEQLDDLIDMQKSDLLNKGINLKEKGEMPLKKYFKWVYNIIDKIGDGFFGIFNIVASIVGVFLVVYWFVQLINWIF